MEIAAVICECNPFHSGHAALFSAIRKQLGSETAIVAIMSGNYVQRGEPAILRKEARAVCLLRGGADLVLELPFPHAAAGAERFAGAGVSLVTRLGCVDVLAFGSEGGTTEELCILASRLEKTEFRDKFSSVPISSPLGCAQKTEAVYREVYGSDRYLSLLAKPNQMLGCEYIRALGRLKSSILPLAIPRVAEKESSNDALLFSAGIARAQIRTDFSSGILRLPSYTRPILTEEWRTGRAPVSFDAILPYYLIYYRLVLDDTLQPYDGMKGGLAARICRAANLTSTKDEFFEALRTKKYTDAYLRRALLYGFFHITRQELNAPPAFTRILALNDRGKRILAIARKRATIPILNRPAEIHRLDKSAKDLADKSIRADAVYSGLMPRPTAPADNFRHTPLVSFDEG